MVAKKIYIGRSPLTNTIFAGNLLKDGKTWGANKQDITVDAIGAVIEHCLNFQKEKPDRLIAIIAGDKKYTIEVKVTDK